MNKIQLDFPNTTDKLNESIQILFDNYIAIYVDSWLAIF